MGFQFNLPVSTKLSRRFVAHTNAGATFTPRARNAAGERAATQDKRKFFSHFASLSWLARRAEKADSIVGAVKK